MLIAVGVTVWLGVLAVGWWCAPRLVPHQDECWYLVVVRRVAGGRRLYRGVFFGAGPWSVWVARPVVRLLGERLLVLRRTVVVLSVVLGGAAWAWTSAVGVPWHVGLAVAAGSVMLSTALWPADNHYGLWSRIGVLVALAAPLALDDALAGGVVGGLGLALALLNKYTLGVIAAPGLLTTAAVTEGWMAGLVAVGIGGAVALVGYAVEARGDVGGAMVRRVFLNKRTFLGTARSGFLAGWRASTGRPAEQLVNERRVSWVAYGLTTLGGGLVLAGGALAVARGDEPDTMFATLALALVALAALSPRADDVHVRSSLPLWTAPAVAAAHALDPAVGVAWAVLVAGAGLVAVGLAVSERRRFRAARAGRDAVRRHRPVAVGPRRGPRRWPRAAHAHGRDRLPAAAGRGCLVPRDRPAQSHAVRLSTRLSVRPRWAAAADDEPRVGSGAVLLLVAGGRRRPDTRAPRGVRRLAPRRRPHPGRQPRDCPLKAVRAIATIAG